MERQWIERDRAGWSARKLTHDGILAVFATFLKGLSVAFRVVAVRAWLPGVIGLTRAQVPAMAQLDDLKLSYRLFMKAYPYRQIDWRPGVILRKPLAESRIAVTTTAAFYLPGQAPFDETIRGGDCTLRVIPADADMTLLRHAHRSDAFDHTGIERDPNIALPLDRLREMAHGGEVGEVAPRHFSLMGSVTAPGRLISATAPEIAACLAEDRVDAVILTPV